MSGVSPDRVKRVPKIFGKDGAFAPWFAGIAGSSMLYFRTLHLATPLPVYLTAPIKAAPVLILFALTRQMIQFGAFGRYARNVGTGLLCSALGDILLELEDSFSSDALFICGLLSFLVGHLFYVGAFSISMQLTDLKMGAVILVLIYMLSLFSFLFLHLPAQLVFPVFIYAAVIATMALTALCRPFPSEVAADIAARWSRYSAACGALIFVVSDSVLAINKFAFRIPAGHDIVMATYYAGQIGITLSTWGAWELKRVAATPAKAEPLAKGKKKASKAD